MRITKRQLKRIIWEEAAKDTKEFDDDSALKGDQDKLPDHLQKAIIDKEVEEEEEEDKKKSEARKMKKLGKRGLRKMIQEERRKVLRESSADMAEFQGHLTSQIENITGVWAEQMETMFEEDPAAFAGRSTKEQWTQQVDAAHDQLVDAIKLAAEKEIDTMEQMLHDGQFAR
jgi:hypothetical protein